MNKLGRPTKYDPIFCEKIIKYFKVNPYVTKKIITTGKNDYHKESFQMVANRMPRFDRFADSIGVNPDTVVEWANKRFPDGHMLAGQLVHPEFTAAYKRAKELQKWFLIENGLVGLFNPRFAIFTAENITDMKQKVLHVGDPENPIAHDVQHEVSDELAQVLVGIAEKYKNKK